MFCESITSKVPEFNSSRTGKGEEERVRNEARRRDIRIGEGFLAALIRRKRLYEPTTYLPNEVMKEGRQGRC